MDQLKRLGIQTLNAGAFSGHSWMSAMTDKHLTSVNPATNEKIADVSPASKEDYETILAHAAKAFILWREVPAPRRGEIIRQMGQALREHKDALGTLVSMEMGKSKQEGDGEVQEMIDIADFAVGQSRMLYGKTMASLWHCGCDLSL